MTVKKRVGSLLLAFALMLSMFFSLFDMTAYAAEKSTMLEDNKDYIVTIEEVNSNSYSSVNLSTRGILQVRSGQYTLRARVHGYDQWSTLRLFDQCDSVAEVKAGTDWTPYEGKSMDGYAEVSKEWGDASQNGNWTEIAVSESIDTATNTAMIEIPLTDCAGQFAIGGYAETTYNDKILRDLKVATYQLDLSSAENYMDMAYWAYGMDGEYVLDYDRMIPITNNTKYDSEETPSGMAAENFIASTQCTTNNGNVSATATIKENIGDEVQGIYPITGTSLEDAMERLWQVGQLGYLLGTYGNTYGENIYNSNTRSFTLEFKGTDPVQSLVTGHEVKIVTEDKPEGYRAIFYLSKTGAQMKTFTDKATNASYTTYQKYVPSDAAMTVNADEQADAHPVEQIKLVADGDKWKAYTFKLTNSNGESIVPRKCGTVRVNIPRDWDLDNLFVAYYRGDSLVTDSGIGGTTYQNATKIVDNENERYLEYRFSRKDWMADGTIVMCQKENEATISEAFAQDGIYKASVKLMKEGADGTLSMANGTLDSNAYIKVQNGEKTVYLNFHSLTMEGTEAYLGAIWNKEISDCTYYDFETKEDGSLLENMEYDPNSELPCVKSVAIKLSDNTITDNSYLLQVLPTAMLQGMSYEQALQQAVGAQLKFYNVKKVSDDTAIPTYQKSVLRRSIDKAKGYTESAYSTETWSALQTALKDGEDYYNKMSGDAGTNNTVSNEIKQKSDAIENALKNLKENEELANARAALKAQIDEAKKIEIGTKTVTAFNELTAAINTAEGVYNTANITVDKLTAAGETLNQAVKTFQSSANVSTLDPTKLEDGDYKVYVKMVRPDGVDSMCNPSIDHWVTLTVEKGNITANLDFQGMTLSGQFGYLQSLKYYEVGYTNDTTAIKGKLQDATVVSTQTNTDGSDVVDAYNNDGNGNAKFKYPDIVSFPLVDGAKAGDSQDVPLQVFVPIMEAISKGTGTQDTMMRIDWTSLKDANDTTQTAVDFETDGVYTLTSALREAGSDTTAAANAYLDKARLIVNNNQITAYVDFKSADDSYLTGMQVLDENDNAVEVTSTTKNDTGELVRASFTLPQNYELTNVKLTDNSGNTTDARLYLALLSAALQENDKSVLENAIRDANNKLNDTSKNYTTSSKEAVQNAIADAQEVVDEPVAIQEEINAAGLALSNAVDTLEEMTKADKSKLEEALTNAKKISNADNTYTEDSFKALTDAIAEAEAVYNDDAAGQGAVDAQVTALEAAYAGLVKTADTSKLTSLIEKAEKLEPGKYTATSWTALQKAFKTADAVNQDANATQEEVEAQVKLLQAAMDALIPYTEASGELADGIYEIDATIMHSNNSQKSMANAALVRPMHLIVKNGEIRAQMQFTYLNIDGTEGYMGQLNYLTYDGDTMPTKNDQDYVATVEEYYTGYDNYNHPTWGTDKVMTTKTDPTTGEVDTRYPEVMSIPMDYKDTEVWLHVYVPVMGTWQYARLQLDWNTVKQVRPSDVNADVLKEQIAEAKKLEQGDASDDTWAVLQAAISSAQEVYDNLAVTQAQLDAQTAYLQQAMAMVNAENKTVDKTKLKAAISQAEKKLQQTDTYTAQSLAVLQQYKEDAEALYNDAKATQAEVDTMTDSLNAAINHLTERTVDTAKLESKIAEAETLAKKTDTYTDASIKALKIAIRNAQNALEADTLTEATVNNHLTALQSAIDALKEKESADKSALKAKISEAQGYVDNASAYTDSSIAALKTAIANAQAVYRDEDATQSGVNAQVSVLNDAITALVKAGNNTLDITKLADGVYSLTGTMVKAVDRETLSMCNDSINHTIKLTVKDGKYTITMDFKGLTIGENLGYLGQLSYYKTGYRTDQYGNNPTGDTAAVTVDSVQKYEDGTVVKDNYGTDYPDVVTFELIPEALKDGFVPLKVVVPIMEKVAAGAGTQPVYLKLDWTSLKSTTDNDKNFTDTTDTNKKTDTTVTTNKTGTTNKTLSTSTLPSSSTGNTSLTGKTGTTGLTGTGTSTGTSTGKSSGLTSASSVKTGDTQPLTGWLALLAISGIALAVLFAEKKLRKGKTL